MIARMPGKSIHAANLRAKWDGTELPMERSESNSRDTSLKLPDPWKIGARHKLAITYEIHVDMDTSGVLQFTKDAFFLPQESWDPEVLPPQGFMAEGGTPPDAWNLVVSVPRDFRVHLSGQGFKRSGKGGQFVYRARQRPTDRYPFVVAGRYRETKIDAGNHQVYLWTLADAGQHAIHNGSDSLVRALDAYDSVFGIRGKQPQTLWIAECPQLESCFTGRTAHYARLLDLPADTSIAEMISLDTLLIGGNTDASRITVAAAPYLAASWLGYGRNGGFFDQQPPLSALPIFAAAVGREAVEGKGVREQMIGSALKEIPETNSGSSTETADAVRAKSFLFFYALREKYGEAVFRRAIHHMLSARQGRGFDLNDLIATFEEETQENVAQFVRQWMKHPGVPEDFRASHGSTTATDSKETER
jgi:hypothetical protein